MSKHASNSLLGGRMRNSHQNSNGGTHGSPNKTNKKPMKSNITNNVKPRPAAEAGESDGESDEEGGGSSAIEELTPTSDDADELALSGEQPVLGAAKRLAGHDTVRDELFSDTFMGETEAGASDDDDYADVENVSDSDDEDLGMDEEQIRKSAEQDLIEEFEKTEQRRNASVVTQDFDVMRLHEEDEYARQLGLLQETNDLFNGDVGPIDLNNDPYHGFAQQADEYQQLLGHAESFVWRMPEQTRSRESSNPISGTQKRVRFEKTPCSSPSVSEDEDPNEAFPDLFTSADDPMIAQQINIGTNYDSQFPQEDYNDADSFYDFDDEDEKLAFQIDEESNSGDETSSHDSDDEGDTTDEETPEVQKLKMEERKRAACKPTGSVPSTPMTGKQATPRTPRGSNARSSTARSSTTPRPGTPVTGKGPRSGFFAADPSRAAITVDLAAGKLKVQPPTKPLEEDKAFWERARSVAGSRDGSRRSSFQIMRSNSSESMPSRPFTAKCTLGSMFNGNLDIIRNHDDHGIAEDLFPQLINRPQSSFSSLTGTEEGDGDRQMDLDMEDLVHIDGSDSETEGAHTGMVTSPTEPDVFGSFHSGNGLERSSSDLLTHLSQHRGAIGSFRQNQHLAKQLSSQALHPAQRASTHEFNALQKGRRGAANTPITPARKKRASQDLTPSRGGVRKSVNSPLTNRRPRSRGNSNANLFQTFTRDPFAD